MSRLGPADVQFTRDLTRPVMGNSVTPTASEEKEATKSSEAKGKGKGTGLYGDGVGRYWPAAAFATMKQKTTCCGHCLNILYVLLGLLTILNAVAVIAVAVTTAFATKIYSSDLSGRLVAMIILAVTAAVALSVIIYAVVAVFRKQAKPLHASSIVLVILAIIQAVIAGVSVRVTPEDEISLSRSLTESFRLAREDNPRHVKIWDTTQSDLTCCGVYSAEDYRPPRIPVYFPPDVPISCCPTYDPDRSELVQERGREICKARKQFYDMGCKTLVVEVFRESATMVLSVSIALIVLEVLEAIIGAIISRKKDSDIQIQEKKPHNIEEGFSGNKTKSAAKS